MKKAEKEERIMTIPEGVYESGLINQELRKPKNSTSNSVGTDAQGNGYPVKISPLEEDE